MTDSGLNLHALAADVVASSTVPDPTVMVDEFVAKIDPSDFREAIRYLARDLITSVIRSRKQLANGGTPQGSHKVAAARDAWRKLLDTPEFVPSAGWVFLREATQSQVMEMALMRRRKSAELEAIAKRYNHIATEMQKRSVLRVGDLPEEVLAAHLDEARDAA